MNASEGETDPLLRVLIVDLDPRVRRGLRALLETQPDIAVIGEADTTARTLECAASLHPSVVLLDLMLPTMDEGLATIRLLAALRQPCVVTSWQGGRRDAALKMGASEFVEKGDSPEGVLAAIRGASRTAERITPVPTP
jgi:DNA-binding NarL/FixJ family response regulator